MLHGFQDGRCHLEDPNFKVEKFCIFVFFRIYSISIGTLNLYKPQLNDLMMISGVVGVIQQPNLEIGNFINHNFMKKLIDY